MLHKRYVRKPVPAIFTGSSGEKFVKEWPRGDRSLRERREVISLALLFLIEVRASPFYLFFHVPLPSVAAAPAVLTSQQRPGIWSSEIKKREKNLPDQFPDSFHKGLYANTPAGGPFL